MKTRRHLRAALVAAGTIVACVAMFAPAAQAKQPTDKPLVASDFVQAAPRGFGDRNNSWAQSMLWWQNKLYVGTSRQSVCSSLFALWEAAVGTISLEFANMWFPYPPSDPDLSCAPDGADLSVQAEIWRWDPLSELWQRVFQSPLALDNPGPGAPAPPRTGKKLPYEIAFRGLTSHVEPSGTEALYAFGVNSTVMWDRTKLPPPRILRSTDGTNFSPIPQTPGTFLGNLPFNPDHSSYRSPVSYRGKLFVLSGPIFGQGTLIASADPAQGDNAWFVAGPPGLLFYELAVFNDWLYLGSFDPATGYSVLKTRAEGTPPYTFVTVVPGGAYLTDRPSKSVVSMHESFGRLYVGTATYTEIIRINPDDTWDLVIGSPRLAPLPGGGSEWKYPVSGLAAGFGHTLNDHAWQMDDPYGYMYVGTYNAATGSRTSSLGQLLTHNMGAHLYRTPDGWYYSAVTTNGFTNPNDPHGGKFDYGIRTMASTPYGEFLGTANDYWGLAIFRANGRRSQAPDPPDRVEVEPTRTGSALLSWQASPSTRRFQIWRAEVKLILLRDDLNFEGWNGTTGNKIPDYYIGPYTEIAATEGLSYIDATVQPGKQYMYYVIAEKNNKDPSEQSNLVTFPLLTPPMTFAQLLREVDRIDQRQRYTDPVKRLNDARGRIVKAQILAATCNISKAIKMLNSKATSGDTVDEDVLEPEATDLEILVYKLARRLQLFNEFPTVVSANEFCTPP